MSSPVTCPAPWCRELEALLRHGPMHIHPQFDEHRVTSFLVVFFDEKSCDGHSYRGQGRTLHEAIDCVIEARFPKEQKDGR
jgi:hypothetical protein